MNIWSSCPGAASSGIARKFCQEYGARYSAVLWLNAANTKVFEKSCSDHANRLGIKYKYPNVTDEVDMLRKWLGKAANLDPVQRRKAAWLLIFDGLSNHSCIKRLLPRDVDYGSIILTTGKPIPPGSCPFDLTNASLRQVKVNPFTEDECFNFLSFLLQQNGHRDTFTIKEQQRLRGISIRCNYSKPTLIFIAEKIARRKISLESNSLHNSLRADCFKRIAKHDTIDMKNVTEFNGILDQQVLQDRDALHLLKVMACLSGVAVVPDFFLATNTKIIE